MLGSAPVLGEGPATVRQFAGFEARTAPGRSVRCTARSEYRTGKTLTSCAGPGCRTGDRNPRQFCGGFGAHLKFLGALSWRRIAACGGGSNHHGSSFEQHRALQLGFW